MPIIGTIGLLWFGYKSVVPLPPYPNSWAVPLTVGWFLIAVVIVIWLRARGKESQAIMLRGRCLLATSRGSDRPGGRMATVTSGDSRYHNNQSLQSSPIVVTGAGSGIGATDRSQEQDQQHR